MVKILSDEEIKEQIYQTHKGTDFELISYERNRKELP
jgi:hypothetical protein